MSDTQPSDSAHEQVPTAALAEMPRLAKRQATENLVHRLAGLGMATAAAKVTARAIVDPADARSRLQRLSPVRVPGGTFYALDSLVWAPSLMAYAVNNREAVARRYPIGVEPGTVEAALYRPLRPPVDAPDGTAQLELEAEEPAHLIWSLERSVKFLLENNDLSASIAAQGVMQHVTAVPILTRFGDSSSPAVMLGTIDGSSRTVSAHSVLGVTPHDVIVKFQNDERVFRSFVAGVEAALLRPLDEISDEDLHRLRALQIPARIFIRYEPDPGMSVGFAKAVDSYVHLIHVEPPKPWDLAASIDAKAVSVLNELQSANVITPKRRLYLEGMMTPAEARSAGFAGEPDERALELVTLVSSNRAQMKQAVRTGVIVLSKAGQVKKEEKAGIAVELGLRASRSTLTRADARGARETLQNAYLHPELWGCDLKPLEITLEELRERALDELDKGTPKKHARVIAAQGAYWLAIRRVLREARFFAAKDERDGRPASRVLDELTHSRWGVEVLYRAILDGREGHPLARVDETGRRVPGIAGEPMDMSHEWLRGAVVPLRTDDEDGPPPDTGPDLPTRMLLLRRQALEKALDRLEESHHDLRRIQDTDGVVLIDKEGLQAEITEKLSERLDDLRRRLERYGMIWEAKNAVAPTPPEDEDVEDDRSIDVV